MMVAGAPVSSSTPRQTHMSERTSTLVRRMERDVSSLRATVIRAASFAAPAALASLLKAYSTIGGRGEAIMPTPMVAGDALALSSIACWRWFTLASAGALWNRWFHVALSRLMI